MVFGDNKQYIVVRKLIFIFQIQSLAMRCMRTSIGAIIFESMLLNDALSYLDHLFCYLDLCIPFEYLDNKTFVYHQVYRLFSVYLSNFDSLKILGNYFESIVLVSIESKIDKHL